MSDAHAEQWKRFAGIVNGQSVVEVCGNDFFPLLCTPCTFTAEGVGERTSKIVQCLISAQLHIPTRHSTAVLTIVYMQEKTEIYVYIRR